MFFLADASLGHSLFLLPDALSEQSAPSWASGFFPSTYLALQTPGAKAMCGLCFPGVHAHTSALSPRVSVVGSFSSGVALVCPSHRTTAHVFSSLSDALQPGLLLPATPGPWEVLGLLGLNSPMLLPLPLGPSHFFITWQVQAYSFQGSAEASPPLKLPRCPR